MIMLFLGNIGSGKTASAVREMYRSHIPTYSNIRTTTKNCHLISYDMIVKKEIKGYKKNRLNNEQEAIFEYKLNSEFWQKVKKPINVILDEAHAIINSRRAMSKTNIIVTEWLSLLRRILNAPDGSTGNLILITQLVGRIDIIAREMSNQIRYHICHYVKFCKNCGAQWHEHSEMSEIAEHCPRCNYAKLLKKSYRIEVLKFKNYQNFEPFNYMREKTYYQRYMINDISKYFPLYDTLQWDNLFAE